MRPGDAIAERFVIERLASAGGMGSVFRALDQQTGEIVAIKTLHRPAHDHDRFFREARVLAELRHPGIVRYVAHGVTGAGGAYLAIEWLEGQDLAARLAAGPLGVQDSLTLAVRVADALSAAHARGVIHRDIKPANLFLVGDDVRTVKILDFGVARFGAVSATRAGTVIGTPAYMAPEQARGDRGVDARADVFALGAVLFECLTGSPPFIADHLMAVLAKVLLEDAPRVAELTRDVPADLDELVAKMLAKDRGERPADGAAVARAVVALDALADRPSGRPPVPPTALTGRELRLLGVVLVRAAGGLRGSPAGEVPASSLGMGLRLGASPDQEAAKALAPLGASAHALMDGSLLATVRARGSATDQAAQAARCALSLRALLPDAPMALALGRATLADRQTLDDGAARHAGQRSQTPMGEVIDRAAGLLEIDAPEGEGPRPIRVDEVTAGLLDLRFDVRGDAAGFLLQGEREIVPVARTVLGKPVPCVGRERELDLLAGLLEECVSEPVARAVLITGPAGVGKSRLRAEFLQQIERRGGGALVLMGWGDPMRVGSPFGVVAPAIRRASGIRDGDPLAVRRQKLRARVGRHLVGDEGARVSEFLGELVSAPFPDEESAPLRAARQDPILMGDQMRRAWGDFLAAECAEQPVVIVLENLHWGDLPSVKFVDAALRSLFDRPLLVLAVGRPEVREAFPRLWEERGVHEIRLADLGPKASERLVRQVLGEGTPPETVARIVEQAAGNALYLEELIRAVAAGKGDRLPETVLAMVEARLEALDADTRRVLRAASVLGQVFWRGGVAALLGERDREADARLAERLRALAELEIVSPRGEGRFPGQAEYTFRSLLLREAAYATLTEPDRRLGHRLAGAWLEEAGETEAVTLAEHFERGGEATSAIAWYRNAAEQALEATDLAAAIARAERAVRCGAEGQDLGALRLLQTEALDWRGDHAEAEQRGLDAMQRLPRGGALWCVAAGEVATASGKLGHVDRLLSLAEAFLAPATPEPHGAQAIAFCRLIIQLLYAGRYEPAGVLLARVDEAAKRKAPRDSAVLARIQQAHGVAALYADDPVAYLLWTELAAGSFERAGDARNTCLQRVNVGNGCAQIGAYEDAERALRDALAAATRIGLATVATVARHNLGHALAGLGALEEACAVEQQAAAEALALGDRRLQAATHLYLALILMTAGARRGERAPGVPTSAEEAERAARTALSCAGQMQPVVAYAQGALARALLAEGRADEAMAASAEGMRLLGELGRIEGGESLLRLAHAECLHAVGAVAPARGAIRAAREQLLLRAARIAEPTYRQRFLERIPENARTLALALEWAGEDDRPWASPRVLPE